MHNPEGCTAPPLESRIVTNDADSGRPRRGRSGPRSGRGTRVGAVGSRV
ncbi:hypothetical protein SAMN05216174_102499 [Actinokineospora iranica]|uniref:Uncharacterized protein n=1 Tax=Actinokineospora iranica TaxID=1271860 RepID=A0A1G6ME74_9PSEU|nr:hypothetical protein SAMN05216174_102499 [Actinokineospora iranica]